jgi:hypothetical protein
MKTKYWIMTRVSKGNSPLNTCIHAREDNIKTYLKATKCDVVRIIQNREKDQGYIK